MYVYVYIMSVCYFRLLLLVSIQWMMIIQGKDQQTGTISSKLLKHHVAVISSHIDVL